MLSTPNVITLFLSRANQNISGELLHQIFLLAKCTYRDERDNTGSCVMPLAINLCGRELWVGKFILYSNMSVGYTIISATSHTNT